MLLSSFIGSLEMSFSINISKFGAETQSTSKVIMIYVLLFFLERCMWDKLYARWFKRKYDQIRYRSETTSRFQKYAIFWKGVRLSSFSRVGHAESEGPRGKCRISYYAPPLDTQPLFFPPPSLHTQPLFLPFSKHTNYFSSLSNTVLTPPPRARSRSRVKANIWAPWPPQRSSCRKSWDRFVDMKHGRGEAAWAASRHSRMFEGG